ncbi:MAG: hypothetical protein Q4A58_00455 [Fusobacterium sp.]|uniref:vWA domain-containing protein n=1 Tax=Fusobacterium sp. TaxID=68766 RepID=UPI0026DBBBDC|nr:hypothetical protein [Fusobacterium sp.]MDO4689759.1 hypothetical protein [Fusobacterium sp.]
MKKFVFSTLTVLFFTVFSFNIMAQIKEKDVTELVFILDRSGSMAGLENETIGGFNSILEKQRKETRGSVIVTTVLFDNEYEILHNRLPIDEVKKITNEEYYVRGMTALLDAIGKSIVNLKEINKSKKNKDSKVLFVIITDGMENASKEFTIAKVKELVELQKKEFKWEFLFLGANIDAIQTAKSFGIDASKAVQYHSDKIGTEKNYRVLNEAVSEFRSGKELNAEWKKEIETDFKERKQQ